MTTAKPSSFILHPSSFLYLLPVILIGLFLRLHGISSQILMDDELHSLLYAIVSPLSGLFTHMGSGATCVPLNVYQKIMLETLGWNEFILRFPTILGGLLCMVVFPFLVRSLFNRRVTLIFTVLLAISPYLIFTTRFSRPYSIYLFFSFVAVWTFYRWVISGHPKYCAVYVFSGAIAFYFHLFAIIVVALPPLCALAFAVLMRLKKISGPDLPQVGPWKMVGALAMWILLSTLPMLPAFFNSLGTFIKNHPRLDPPTLSSFAGFTSLVAGHSAIFVVALFCVLWLWGQIGLLKTNPLLGVIFEGTFLSYLVVIMVFAPKSMNNPIQIARYCVPTFPMIFICVSLALDQGLALCSRKIHSNRLMTGKNQSHIGILCLGAVLLMVGPLPGNLGRVNNFTNHAAYQESYEPLNWDQPYHSQVYHFMTLRKEKMSDFYRSLEKESGDPIIVEYPMMAGFHLNIYYYYQHFHQKRVIAGYVGNLVNPPLHGTGDVFYGDQPLDFLLSRVRDKGKLKFRNMVDLTDMAALFRTHAKYVVIHENIIAEEVGQRTFDLSYLPAVSIEQRYRKEFGEPVFKDAWLTVFEVQARSSFVAGAK